MMTAKRMGIILAIGASLPLLMWIKIPETPFSMFSSVATSDEHRLEEVPVPAIAHSVIKRSESRLSPSTGSVFPSLLGKLQLLAETNPASALDHLEDLLRGDDSLSCEEVMAWISNHPIDAAHWMESLPDGPLREAVLDRVVGEIAHRNPAAALALAEGLAPPDLRDTALSSVLRRWATDSPDEALRVISVRPEWVESPYLGRAFSAAASAHPQRIGELLALIPANTMDASFLTLATESLLRQDANQLTRWVEIIQDPEQRSAIVETVMLHTGRNWPEMAFAWATQLSDADQRHQALLTLFEKAGQRSASTSAELLNLPWLSAADRELIQSRTAVGPPSNPIVPLKEAELSEP